MINTSWFTIHQLYFHQIPSPLPLPPRLQEEEQTVSQYWNISLKGLYTVSQYWNISLKGLYTVSQYWNISLKGLCKRNFKWTSMLTRPWQIHNGTHETLLSSKMWKLQSAFWLKQCLFLWIFFLLHISKKCASFLQRNRKWK